MTEGSIHEPRVNSPDHGDLLDEDEIAPPKPPSHKQWISIGVFVLMSIGMIATGLVVTAANEKRESVLTAQHERLEESVSGRRELLRTWINSRILSSRRLTESELVRMFVSDVAHNPAGAPLPRSLLDQRPYFQTLIAEFAEQNDLERAAVIDREGRLLLGSSGRPLDMGSILASANASPSGWESIVLPVRSAADNSDDLVIDMLVPMPRVQTSGDAADEHIAIFVQTLPATDVLTDLLTISSDRSRAEAAYLIQERGEKIEQLRLGEGDIAVLEPAQSPRFLPGQDLAFGLPSPIGGRMQYAFGKPVPGTGWTIVHAADAGETLKAVNHFIIAATGIALAILLGATLCFAAFWWRRTGAHHHELMLLYQDFADRLDKRRRFLAAITNSISDWLTVTNDRQQLIYVNPAFAAALGSPKREILGRRADDVLPMERYAREEHAFDGLIPDDQAQILHIGGRDHVVSTASSDLKDQSGHAIGTVTVMRDQTELIEHRQHRIRALTDIINAFVHTIERRDSFLLGHTYRLRSYAIAIGRKLGLDDDGLAGIALAASLSQIGKIFVPDEILTKPKRHNQQEAAIMRSHIEHAMSILSRIDFGFPVVDMLSQMHERLDGSGYPNSLAGDEIDLPGRILGVADVFCARTAPRSYRDRLSAGNALYFLASNAGRYDVRVIAALAEIVSEEGELDPGDFDWNLFDPGRWTSPKSQKSAASVKHRDELEPTAAAV